MIVFKRLVIFQVAGRAAVQPMHYSFISIYKSLLLKSAESALQLLHPLRSRSQTAGPSSSPAPHFTRG